MNRGEKSYVEPKNPVGRVAELFAGVGGFRIGLSRANLKTVFSNQWEPSTKVQHASEVYVARFGEEGHTNVDIAELSSIDYDFDILVGGFPCQDYSVAKAAKSAIGLEGKKGVLWWEILRLTLLHKPKYIFLENVDRLLKSPTKQKGRDFAVMLATLGNAGYFVEWRIVNAADYGLPQRRVRVFILATRLDLLRSIPTNAEELLYSGVLAHALPFNKPATLLNSISVSSNPVEVSNHFPDSMQFKSFGNAGTFFENQANIWNVDASWIGEQRVLGDVLVDDNDVPEEYWIPAARLEEWRYQKGAKKIERTNRESGFSYLYSEGAISFPDSTQKPSRTILTGEGGTTPSRFKHVIERPYGLRRLVPIELERLCGFPDDWTNPSLDKPVSDSRRAFFMGNALVVGLVGMVGHELSKRIRMH